MKLKFKTTGVTLVNNGKLLVQLQGEFGNVQLNVPSSQSPAFQIGKEAILEINTLLGFSDEIDETKTLAFAATKGLLDSTAFPKGLLDGTAFHKTEGLTGGLAGAALLVPPYIKPRE